MPWLRESQVDLHGDDLPFVSVVIPARDEGQVIGETVRRMVAQSWPRLEVIVVDDGSQDDTAEIVEGIAIESDRVQLVRGDALPEGWLGKPWALEQGGRIARGEILLFVDADLRYEPGALAAMISELERSGASLLSILPRMEMRGLWEAIFMPQLAMMALGLMPAWLSNRSATRWLAIGGGTGNLIHRSEYERIGGHTRLRNAVIDDIGLARLVRRFGGRTLFYIADDLAHLRMYQGGWAIVDGFTKNMFAAMGGSLLITLAVIVFAMVVHLGPYLAALGAIVRASVGLSPVTAWLVAAAAIVPLTLGRVILFRSLRYPLASAIAGYPVAVTMQCFVMARSAWRSGIRGRTEWRGRTYRDVTTFGVD